MPLPPYLLVATMVGATYGVLFHLWRGKTIRDLIIYFLTGILGFIIGQVLGTVLGLNFLLVGQIHLVAGTVASWGLLFFMQWFKPFPQKPA
jgi:uncharacterized membrane protein YjjP (DUF1212 family)